MNVAAQEFRGFHYDLARGNYDSVASLRRLARLVADCGLNELVLYMENLWRLDRHPELAHPHSYDMGEMESLGAYARECGVDLIPSITTLGHSAHTLRKPGYQHLAFPGGGDFDVFNPAMYDLFADFFDEILPHFTSPYVFINGDETSYTHLSEQAREEARRNGLGALYGRAMGRLTRMVLERGRRPIMWHDMLLHHPEAMEFLPEETVVAYWYYDYQPAFPAVEFFCSRGFDVIAAPGLLSGGGGLPCLARAIPNIQGQAREAGSHAAPLAPRAGGTRGRCLGTMLTVWESVHWEQSLLAMYATGRWTHDAAVSMDDVLRDFAPDVFGLDSPAMGKALSEASARAGDVCLLEEAIQQSHSEPERILLTREIARRHQRLGQLSVALHKGAATKNVDLHGNAQQFAGEIASPGPAKGSNADGEREFFCMAVSSAQAPACRVERLRTPYGHDLLVLTNGLIAVAILPDFAATMIEWLVLDEKPWSALASGYAAWAAAEPRVPGDPGLGSPWGASRIGGWRETIFYNSRLNPCTLWGRPFRVEVVEETRSEISVECAGRNEVAEVRRTVRLEAGRKTITVESTAANRLGPCHLSVRPNALHVLPGTPVPLLRIQDDGAERSLLDHNGTMHFVPEGEVVRVLSPLNEHYIQVRFRRDEIEQFLAFYSTPQSFTIEPFGIARHCQKGESVHLWLEYEIT